MKLEDIKTLCDGASEGPWTYTTCYGVATIEDRDGEAVAHAVDYVITNDAALIAKARQLIPALLEVAVAASEELREDQVRLAAALNQLEEL